MQRSGVQALLCASYFAGTLLNIDNFTKSNKTRTGLPCGTARNGADPCGMMRIRAEWCGSVRTGVESVLVRAESAQSVRIRVEHQGEGKLLQTGTNGVAVFKRLTYHSFSLGMPRFPRFFITTHVYSYNYIYIYYAFSLIVNFLYIIHIFVMV